MSNLTIRVDFYLLNIAHQGEIDRFLCHLVDKVYQQQQSAYLHTASQAHTLSLDDKLWTFRDTSFVPHQLEGTGMDNLVTPIFIGTHKPPHLNADILFNLTGAIPPFFSEFSRIIEIVSEEKNNKNESRKKYKFYKEQTCHLTTHRITHYER